ncbi:DEAD/DEAH box helicase [Allostreptomyces psammosilenae]|uniref:DEAD/DEAH box helicase domain-containing protein n=1 Tax=Allostreptomyces psammosilenae TaxID=1892865 RepID=A0A852ZWJ0_9ACTN|nr:DEAD/DEAH box helicase [Allostreptomyces psammosilenae]NYI05620.1 DEAD/DEAH box helicase domain-containing protein [Allostreptomyces psammosilenae]
MAPQYPPLDTRPAQVLTRLTAPHGRTERVTHTEHLPARPGRHADWPEGIAPEVVAAFRHALGIERPWEHQSAAARAALAGRSVVLATGTASGKSAAYLAPVLTTLLEGAATRGGRGATSMYLAPTKALAADQLRVLQRLLRGPWAAPGGDSGDAGGAGDRGAPGGGLSRLDAALYDGDTPPEERERVRRYSHHVLTNPDMLHRGILPDHARWASFLRALRYVVVDECHSYRGVFGSHVAQVLRRLRRVCAHYGSSPVFVLASATVSAPQAAASRLTGLETVAISDDASPRGPLTFVLWEPPLTPLRGERDAPVRRSATAEAAELLTDLVLDGVRTVAFVKSRRGAEVISLVARERLAEVDGQGTGSPTGLASRVAAYRGGYLPQERRRLERDLHAGRLLGLASTPALEMGVDVSGLDAVLLTGYPGTRASLWQQAGRAGRAGQEALAVLIARDDPLDTYLVHHPKALFGSPVESTVLDPDNPHVLAPHLCAAAAERPLTAEDLELFGPSAGAVVEALVRRGLLRRRPGGWFWTRRDRPAALVDLRGSGGPPVQVVEAATGNVLGTVDAAAAHGTVHKGAVHLHQGLTYLVRELDLESGVALVARADPPYTTTARDVTEIAIRRTERTERWGRSGLHFGTVEVTSQVVSYLRRKLVTGEVIGEHRLDLPPRTLVTKGVWWTVTEEQLAEVGLEPRRVPGAAHAAEHASIGLLPLFATCDRWDIGGVSVPLHADTGLPTVFVHDGHSGGAGFAERGFTAARQWLAATREAIAACECEEGCPSCVQSPKCGNGNEPLDKEGAVLLLDVLLGEPVGGGSPAAG